MPFDKTRYPADWKAISLRIRARDEWQCKWCGLPNNAIIRRLEDGESYTHYGYYTTKTEWDTKWARLTPKLIRVVLTVAHVDHDSGNNADDNLAALCQQCHLRHDAKQHAENAARTRVYKQRAAYAEAGQVEFEL